MAITTVKRIFLEESVRHYAPDAAGVCALYDIAGDVTYYGMSESSIRDRLIAHATGNSANPCTKRAWMYNFEQRNDAESREEQLLRLHKFFNNGALPKCNSVSS